MSIIEPNLMIPGGVGSVKVKVPKFDFVCAKELTQEKVNTPREIILKALNDKPETTQKELAKLIRISIDGVKNHTQKMTIRGIIKQEGSTKAGKWIILSD